MIDEERISTLKNENEINLKNKINNYIWTTCERSHLSQIDNKLSRQMVNNEERISTLEKENAQQSVQITEFIMEYSVIIPMLTWDRTTQKSSSCLCKVEETWNTFSISEDFPKEIFLHMVLFFNGKVCSDEDIEKKLMQVQLYNSEKRKINNLNVMRNVSHPWSLSIIYIGDNFYTNYATKNIRDSIQWNWTLCGMVRANPNGLRLEVVFCKEVFWARYYLLYSSMISQIYKRTWSIDR